MESGSNRTCAAATLGVVGLGVGGYLVANYPGLVAVGYNPSDLHGISRVNPLIIGVITHLLSGMNHQVVGNGPVDIVEIP